MNEIHWLTWIELSHLRAAAILPESFEKARIGLEEATPIYDLNGEELFRRTPLSDRKGVLGFAEIDANRPLISFVRGLSPTVAGYTRSFLSLVGQPPFRGLLVYDPWPPNVGVVTRRENYNTTTYRRTFTARLQKA